MKTTIRDSLSSSKGSIGSKKHYRSQSTTVSKPREKSIKGIRESYLEEYMSFKEDKAEKTTTNIMKLNYIIKNAKEISEILDFEVPESPLPQTARASRLKKKIIWSDAFFHP